MKRASTWAVCVVLVSHLAPPVSRAAPVSDPTTVQEAQDRFRRGVSLYEEGDATGALVELERAYQLAPHFKILYNLAQISFQTRNYAAALQYFGRYLADGGDQILPARRREIENEIRSLKQRTGRIDVQVAEKGSEISIDDAPVGTSPLGAPVLANVGRHRVEVMSASGQRRSRHVALAGEETVTVSFDGAGPLPPLAPAPITPTASLLAAGQDPGAPHQHADQLSERSESPSRVRRSSNWLPWTLTAAFAVGAGVTGGLALARSSEARDELNTFPASQGNLDQLRSEQQTFSRISDGLLIGTLVMAGVSLYLGLSRPSEGTGTSPDRSDLAQLEP
jgi:tetratricopeptide (TPR) repeat protein